MLRAGMPILNSRNRVISYRSCNSACSVSGAFVVFLTLCLAAVSDVSAATRDEQRCITTMNDSYRGLAATVGVEVESCFRTFARGRDLSPYPLLWS